MADQPPQVGGEAAAVVLAPAGDTFSRSGPEAAWRKFFAITGLGPTPDGEQPRSAAGPVPPPTDTSERMFGHCLRPTTRYRPDISALQAAPTRVVVAAGATSAGQLPYRAAVALAEQLGAPLTEFPGDHAGYAAQPERSARVLRRVLTEVD